MRISRLLQAFAEGLAQPGFVAFGDGRQVAIDEGCDLRSLDLVRDGLDEAGEVAGALFGADGLGEARAVAVDEAVKDVFAFDSPANVPTCLPAAVAVNAEAMSEDSCAVI